MAYFAPLSSFLGCFSLSFGVMLFLFLHLWETALSGMWGVYDLFQDDGSVSYTETSAAQVFSACWNLLGIPIMLAGIYGSFYRTPSHLWTYYYYLCLSFIMDFVYLVQIFIFQDACVRIAGEAVVDGGQSFACGVARTVSALSVVCLTAALLYMIHVVWSYCEEIGAEDSSFYIETLMRKASYGGKSTTEKYFMQKKMDEADLLMETAESVGNGAVIVYGAVASGSAQLANVLTRGAYEVLSDLENLAGGTQVVRNDPTGSNAA